jgi:hypothetical protein
MSANRISETVSKKRGRPQMMTEVERSLAGFLPEVE